MSTVFLFRLKDTVTPAMRTHFDQIRHLTCYDGVSLRLFCNVARKLFAMQ